MGPEFFLVINVGHALSPGVPQWMGSVLKTHGLDLVSVEELRTVIEANRDVAKLLRPAVPGIDDARQLFSNSYLELFGRARSRGRRLAFESAEWLAHLPHVEGAILDLDAATETAPPRGRFAAKIRLTNYFELLIAQQQLPGERVLFLAEKSERAKLEKSDQFLRHLEKLRPQE